MGVFYMQFNIEKKLNKFIKAYEDATNSHDFNNVRPLVEDDAIYYFSEGTYKGIEAINKVFEKNWTTIEEEIYEIRDIQWILQTENSAACVYKFYWKGFFKGEFRQGSGRGTNILSLKGNTWKIVHEHLSTSVD